jgi:[ribosomal protein S18]-alanine N-acetyltransferase
MTRRLRPIDAVDISGLARLHAQCFPDDHWDVAALAELLAMRGASGHLLEEIGESQPLGLILDLIAAEHAEILTLGVAPGARRQGIARMLLDDLFRRARRAGARSVGLEAAADNLAARRLYEACGFAQTGQRPGYYRRAGATVDALVFRRTLLG